ncbi:MAG TPA: hypothetical protein VKV20_00235 [Ktedonobacteraceae bacterium]|nr:hypothetical protein [Ktedonobacteraceae bacterium]
MLLEMAEATSNSIGPRSRQDQFANLGSQGNDQAIPQYGSRDNTGKFSESGGEPGYSRFGARGLDRGAG